MVDTSIGLDRSWSDSDLLESVWVLDDPRAGTAAQAIGIAERLGVPFRRIPLTWNLMAHAASLSPGGSLMGLGTKGRARFAARSGRAEQEGALPMLALSSGSRSAAVALWLKARFGTRIVHCMRPGFRAPLFDLLVIPEHDRPAPASNVLPVLGAPHRLSPLVLLQAEAAWRERLDHLPHPRICLLVGGGTDGLLGAGELVPALAHRLGARVAAVARRMGGSVLATTSRRTGAEASDALAAGLESVHHLLFRWGEPGENPYAAFLASADALVVTGDSVSMLSEACATEAPVFIALPEIAGPRHRRLHASLINAGQARPFSGSLIRWKRQPLDEAGRAAAEIRRRFSVE